MFERCGYCSIHELIQESTLLKKQVILSVTKTVGAFSLIWGSVSTCADIFQNKSVFCEFKYIHKEIHTQSSKCCPVYCIQSQQGPNGSHLSPFKPQCYWRSKPCLFCFPGLDATADAVELF